MFSGGVSNTGNPATATTGQLLVVRLVVRQRLAAFCASDGRASPASTSCRTGVVPNALCVLRRFRRFGWGGRIGDSRDTLRQRIGTGCRGSRAGVICWRVVGCVVNQGGTTFCTGSRRTSATFTALRAGVVPNTRCVLRRLWCGRGRSSGSGRIASSRRLVALDALYGGITGSIAVVFAGRENSEGTEYQYSKEALNFHFKIFVSRKDK